MLWQGSSKTFYDFAHGFFDDDAVWLKDRLLCSGEDYPALSPSYIHYLRSHLQRYIMPFFAQYKLYELKPTLTKLFRITLLEEGIAPFGEKGKPLSAKTVNNIVCTLKIITDSFLADELITADPLKGIRPLKRRENVVLSSSMMTKLTEFCKAYLKVEQNIVCFYATSMLHDYLKSDIMIESRQGCR